MDMNNINSNVINNIQTALTAAQSAVNVMELNQCEVLSVSVDIVADGFKPVIHVLKNKFLDENMNSGAVQVTMRNMLGKTIRTANMQVFGCRVMWLV